MVVWNSPIGKSIWCGLGTLESVKQSATVSIPRLVLWSLPAFATAESAMGFQLHRALVRPQYVSEVQVGVVSCPLKPLLFVYMANKLAIRTATKSPPQRGSTVQDSPEGQIEPFAY